MSSNSAAPHLHSSDAPTNVRPLRKQPDVSRRPQASAGARAKSPRAARSSGRRPDERVDLWDPDRLAEHLGVSARFVRRLVEERRVPYLKVGKFVRFDPAEVDDWLEQQRVKAARG